MRRTAAFALMISLALLSACGGGAERAAADNFRQRLSAAEQISFTADERAEYPGKTEEYTLRYSESGGEASVEVVKPDIIAGISARVKDGGGTLSYDGAELNTGPLPGGLTPISALPALTEAMKSGHIDSVWREGEYTVAQITPDDGETVTVWFDGGMAPCRAEICSGETVTVFCGIENFTCSR